MLLDTKTEHPGVAAPIFPLVPTPRVSMTFSRVLFKSVGLVFMRKWKLGFVACLIQFLIQAVYDS